MHATCVSTDGMHECQGGCDVVGRRTHQLLQEALHTLLELGPQLCRLQCRTLWGQLAKVEPGGQVGQGLQSYEVTGQSSRPVQGRLGTLSLPC